MKSKLGWKLMFVILVALAGVFMEGRSLGAFSMPQTPMSVKALDYDYFKAQVEPIFLKRRAGHARCYACHGSGTGPQYLVPLSPGSASWDEEQSRRIFRNVSALADRDDPMNSRILIHPLSPLAGGDIIQPHGGGRQFESKTDPDWQKIAAWVTGTKLDHASANK